jgi:hypothetical protein
MKKLLNFTFLLLIPNLLWASSQISIATGAYSLNGKTANRSTSTSGLGAYRLGFTYGISENFQVKIGYNVTYESIFTGDSIYGLDIGGSWLFFGPMLFETYKADGINIKITRDWTPYVGFQFNQRQFQSNKSNYSGLGVHLGSHFPIYNELSWHSEVRYNNLSGPSNATATDMSLLIGVSRDF